MNDEKEYIEPKYDITSESFNLCECCGCSWCECGFEREESEE
jgi:hypothetical protein